MAPWKFAPLIELQSSMDEGQAPGASGEVRVGFASEAWHAPRSERLSGGIHTYPNIPATAGGIEADLASGPIGSWPSSYVRPQPRLVIITALGNRQIPWRSHRPSVRQPWLGPSGLC